MAENLFKDSDPDCNVPAVPVVDFTFVEDCFIEPVPPPIFECLPPLVPNEPCISCPEFDVTTTFKSGDLCCPQTVNGLPARDALSLEDVPIGGYVLTADPPASWRRLAPAVWIQEECTPSPRFEISVAKTNDNPCRYDFNVELDVPCPVIEVTNFSVNTHTTQKQSSTCCEPYEVDYTVSSPADLGSLDPRPPKDSIVKTIYPGTVSVNSSSTTTTADTYWLRINASAWDEISGPGDSSYITVASVAERTALTTSAAPAGTIVRISAGGTTTSTTTTERAVETLASAADLERRRQDGVLGDIVRAPKEYKYYERQTVDDEDTWVETEPALADQRYFINTGTTENPNWVETIGVPDAELAHIVDTPADLDSLAGTVPTNGVIKTQRPNVDDTFATRDCLDAPTTAEVGDTVRVAGAGPDFTHYELVEDENGEPTWAEYTAKPEDAQYFKNTGTAEEPQWELLEVPEPSGACANKFSITPRSCDPENPDAGCQFDVELNLNIPIPVPPCPAINVTNFSVSSYNPNSSCCQAQVIDVATKADLDAMLGNENLAGSFARLTDPNECEGVGQYWRLDPAPGAGLAAVAVAGLPCDSRFVVTTSHKPPEDCNDTGECQFDIELDIKVPVPVPPCPQISGDDKVNITAGYADEPCVTCDSDLTVDSYDALADIPAEDLKPGMYVTVQDVVTTYTLDGDRESWNPDDPVRLVHSAAELDAIPPQERNGLRVTLQNPTRYFKASNGNWVPMQVPTVDVGVDTILDRDALSLEVAPPGAIVKTTNGGDQYWVRDENTTGPDSWSSVEYPVPDTSVQTELDLDPSAVNNTGTVVEIKEPPKHYVYQGGEWVADYTPVAATVFEEQDLNTVASRIPTSSFVPGITAAVRWPTNRYRLDPATMTWVPARCQQNNLGVISSKIPGENCGDPDQCNFDLGLELVVPIPKPPCPEINVERFKVDVGFVGGDVVDPDENCIECLPDLTEPTYDSNAKNVAATEPAGTIVKIETQYPRYVFTPSGWLPDGENENGPSIISVPDNATLDTLQNGESYNGVPISTGTIAIVASPDSLFRLSANLYDWVPVRNVSNGPASKQITVATLAEATALPFGRRYAGLYIKISEPPTTYVLNIHNEWVAAPEPPPALNIVDEIERDALDTAGLEYGTIAKLSRPAEALVSDGDGKFHATTCPKKNQFTISKKTIPGKDCTEPDTCEFNLGLDLAIPIPRIPCPIININQFDVNTHFKAEPEQCCVPKDNVVAVIIVADIEARDALSFEEAPEDSIAQTQDTGLFWLRVSSTDLGAWEATEDPNADICGSLFKIVPKHRKPENCQDPGQCEFDIDLVIDVPIPRIPCPIITTDLTVNTGYADSPCVSCVADTVVQTKNDLDNIPNPTAGMYAKVVIVVTKYRWTGAEWSPAETTNTAEEANVFDTWADVPADLEEDGAVIEVVEPSPRFIVTAGAPISGSVPSKYEYQLSPAESCDADPLVFDSRAGFDAYAQTVGDLIPVGTCVVLNQQPRKYSYVSAPVGGTSGNPPVGWTENEITADCTNAKVIYVETEEDLPTDDIETGTIAVISNYADRYKYESGWQPAPCPKNSFRVLAKRCPPTDCQDPGQCEFDLKLDIVVPIPKPPCPEINVNSFSVTAASSSYFESEECQIDHTVSAFDDLATIPAPAAGATALVSSDNEIYVFSTAGTWDKDIQKTECCTGSSFKITTRHEKCGPAVVVATIAERDALRSPEDIEEGEIVEVTGPPKTHWRAGNGFTTARWTEVPVDECCKDAEEKCIFDLDLNIKVPLPPIVCPEFVGSVHTNVGYEDTFCTSCIAHITVIDKDALPAYPPLGFTKKYYYGKVQQAAHQFVRAGAIWAEVGRIDIATGLPISGGDNKPVAFVATENDLDSVLDGLVSGGIVEVLFPADRYRKNVWLGTPWERYPCSKIRTVSKKIDPTCGSPEQCVLGFELDFDIVLPPPPCPEFAPSIRVHSVYEKNGELCDRCPAECTFNTLSALNAASGITNGTTAFVEQNKTKYMWLSHLGGWVPTGCQSSIIVAKRPPVQSLDCETPKDSCVFDLILDIVVPIPQPPCPEINIRRSDFKTGCAAKKAKFDVSVSKRVKTECGKDEDEQEDKQCIFDFDFDLEIPCPLFFGGPIKVVTVPPGPGAGGWINVKDGCAASGNPVPCPPANQEVFDFDERNRRLIQLIRDAVDTTLKKNETIAKVENPPTMSISPCSDAGFYVYGGGVETGDPKWYPLGADYDAGIVPDYTVDYASELSELALDIAETVDAGFIDQIFKTQVPEPNGTYWKYLGGQVNGAPQWEKIVCSDTEQENCAFAFGAVIAVPFCTPELEEDDDLGTHTRVPKEDRLKIFYLKPGEYCPPDEEDNCPDAIQIGGYAELFALLGKAPEPLRNCIDAQGNPVEDPIPLAPGVPTIFETGGSYYRVKPGNSLPIQFELIPCGGFGPVPLPCPRDYVSLPGGLPPADELGKEPDDRAVNGAVFQTPDGKQWKLIVPGGGKPNPINNKGFFIEFVCGGTNSARLIVVPDPVNPCKMWYALKIKICLNQVDHVAKCTEYYGDPCCDTGCPCDLETCCDESEKASVEDGSQGTGIPPFYRPDLPADDFKAIPANKTNPAALPRLAQQADPPPAEREDPCREAVETASSGCTDLPEILPEDTGYRPYKALELNIFENYPEDRLTPPTIEYNLEAAMNCLHGGEVTVKKGARPEPPAEFKAAPDAIQASGTDRPRMAVTDPDAIGEGKIWITQNRVNLDITLYTTECPTETTTPPSEFKAPPGMFEAHSQPEQKTLTPALLAELISAINTDPQLKAAIRNIVNQPD